MTNIPINWLFCLVTFQWDYKVKISEYSVQAESKTLDYSDITRKPELNKGFFWSNIVFPSTTGGQFKISGINNKNAQFIFDSIINGIQDFHREELSPYCNLIPKSYKTFKSYFKSKYVKHSLIENWKFKNTELHQKLNNEFALQSLSEEERKNAEKYLNLVSQVHSIRESENRKIITNELEEYRDY